MTGLSESSCRISASLVAEQDFTLFPLKAHLPSLLTFSEPPPCSTRHNTHSDVCLAHKGGVHNFFYKISQRVPGPAHYLCRSFNLIYLVGFHLRSLFLEEIISRLGSQMSGQLKLTLLQKQTIKGKCTHIRQKQ